MAVTSFSSVSIFFYHPSHLHGSFAIPSSSSASFSSSPLQKGLIRHQDANLMSKRAKGRAVRVLANPNVSPPSGKGKVKKEVIMVDPLEAKKLAAKQMEEIKAREKLKRRREIEAINGGWAIIGLTIGLVIEGQSGKGILAQLAGYWSAVVHLFVPST